MSTPTMSEISGKQCTILTDQHWMEYPYFLQEPGDPDNQCQLDISSVYKIDEFGARMDKVVITFDKEEDLCLTFLQTVRKTRHHLGMHDCMLGERVHIILKGLRQQSEMTDAMKLDATKKDAIILVPICCCRRCEGDFSESDSEEDPDSSDADDGDSTDSYVPPGDDEHVPEGIDTTRIQLSAAIHILLVGRDESKYVELECFPGCTNRFDIDKDAYLANRNVVLFYGFTSMQELDSLYWKIFEVDKSGAQAGSPKGKIPKIPRSSKDTTPEFDCTLIKIAARKVPEKEKDFSGRSWILKKMLDEKLFPDFKIISSDGIEHPCHRAVIAVRSEIFTLMLAKPDCAEAREGILRLDDHMDSKVVETLLKYLYYEDLDLTEKNEHMDMRLVVSLFKLAHRYYIPTLVVAIANFFITNRWRLSFADFGHLGDLHNFIELVENNVIMFRLRIAVDLAVTDLIKAVLKAKQLKERNQTVSELDTANVDDEAESENVVEVVAENDRGEEVLLDNGHLSDSLCNWNLN